MKVWVEKKSPFDVEAQSLYQEIHNYLNIASLAKIRFIYGYDIDGLSQEQLTQSLDSVLIDHSTEKLINKNELTDADYRFAIAPLEGQYDQISDSCQSLIKWLCPETASKVKTFQLFLLYGVSKQEAEIIQNYYFNPMEYQLVNMDETWQQEPALKEIKPVEVITGFRQFSESELTTFASKYRVAMGIDNLLFSQNYFNHEQRDPTITELRILDTYWSDHCRHSTFQTVLENVDFEGAHKLSAMEEALRCYAEAEKIVYPTRRPLCLMDIATMEMKKMSRLNQLTDLEKSDEVNACSIEASGLVDGKKEDFIVMFKNETHNHPTEIEPYGGAATCIGGGIRDPLSGRGYVFGAMRITGAADPRESFKDTLEGKLPQRMITRTAAKGYSTYANQIGLASGYLREYYHDGFKAKRMECGALVAFNHKKNITRANPEVNDVILLVGGPTGLDGLGGATGSSNEQGNVVQHSAEVQKGDAILERTIVRLFKKPEVSRLIKKCNDFGAGGVSVAIGEMAESLQIDLNQVPLKYPALDGTEIAISESQERMAVLLNPADVDAFIKYAEAENVNAVVVATVTNTQRMIMEYRGQTVCNLSYELLSSGGVRQSANVLVKTTNLIADSAIEVNKENWLKHVSQLNHCSQQSIASQFDATVGGQTIFMPFGGKFQKTPEQGLAMRLPLEQGQTDLGTVMSVGFNPEIATQSPFHGAVYAVLESIMKVVSMGGNIDQIRLSFQEYFERMNQPQSWGKVYSALMGAFLVQDKLNIPSIGGKDSMSGSFKDIHVPPSLISFALATCDVTKLVSRAFKQVNSHVYCLKTTQTSEGIPDFEELQKNIKLLSTWIKEGKVQAASVVGTAGIAGAISEMCLGNQIGFKFNQIDSVDYFNANYVDVIIESTQELPLPLLGTTTATSEIKINDNAISLVEIQSAWESTLNNVFDDQLNAVVPQANTAIKSTKNKAPIKSPIKQPNALIAIFYGTNGEYSLERQLVQHHFLVKSHVLSLKNMQQTLVDFADKIDQTDLLVLPSGFSLGAEPNGSSKMITFILCQPAISNAIERLVQRGGLVLGFAEGFKALVDSGLIQHGKVAAKTDSLTIGNNASGSFVSKLVHVRYLPTGTVENAALATAEGRVYLSENDYQHYVNNGQILSIYIDREGQSATNNVYNPCGSYYSIEGMSDPSGQIIGRMTDSARMESGLYANVVHQSQTDLFLSIVNYFQAGDK